MKISTRTYCLFLLTALFAFLGTAETARGQCPAPLNVEHTVTNHSGAIIQWNQPTPRPDSYIVEWREIGTQNWVVSAPISSNQTTTPGPDFSFLNISILTHGSTYEYRVKSVCGANESPHLPTDTFTVSCNEVEPLVLTNEPVCLGEQIVVEGVNGNFGVTQQMDYVAGPPVITPTNLAPISFRDHLFISDTMWFAGTYWFIYTMNDSVCGTYADTVDVTVDTCASNCANFFADAGPNFSVCQQDTIMLQGNVVPGANMDWAFMSGPSTVIEVDQPNGASIAYGNLMVGGVYTFGYTVFDPVCGIESDTMQVVIDSCTTNCANFFADAGPDFSVCELDTIWLQGNVVQGASMDWQLISSLNMLSVFNFSNGSARADGPLLPASSYYFRYSVSDPVCGTFTDVVEVTVDTCGNNCANFFADAGPDRDVCQNDTLWVNGNQIPGASGNWWLIGGPQPPPVYNSIDNELFVTDFDAPGLYTFAYTLFDSTCGTHADTMQVTVLPAPVAGFITGSQVSCQGDTAWLSLNNYQGNIIGWEYFTNNNPNPVFTAHPYNWYALVANELTFVRAIVANGCDTVSTNVFTVAPSGGGANVAGYLYGDTVHCGTQNQGRVELLGHTGTIVEWEISFDGFQTSFPFNWTNNYFNYSNLGFDLWFRVKVTDGVCDYYSNVAAIRIDSTLANPGFIYGDSTICSSDTVLLQVANNQAPVIQWEVSTDNFNSYSVIGGSQPWLFDVPTQNTQYRAKVGAAGGCAAYTSVWNVWAQNCCPAPDWISVDSVLYAEAQVNWGTPPGTNITGYDVYFRQLGQSSWTYHSRANSGPVWLNGLNADTQYEVKVVTLCGNSFSPEVSDTFRTLQQPCFVPQNLSIDSVAVNWALVTWDASPGASSYLLRYRVVGTSAWQFVTANGPAAWLSGLSMNTEYEVQVRSRCGAGNNSNWTARERFLTGPGAAGCPVPTSLIADTVTQNSAVLRWAPVSGVIGYQVRYRVSGSSAWSAPSFTTLNEYFVSGLSSLTVYEFQVRSVCGGSFSAYSNTGVFTTQASLSCQPPAQNLAINTTATTATLQWNHVPGYVVYIVYYRAKGAANWKINSTVNNFITLSGLNPNTNYEVQMRTYCLNGVSAFTPIINFYTIFIRAQVVQDAASGLALRVYPNPNQGRFTVEIEAPEGERVGLKIADLTGRTVLAREEDVHAGVNEIPVEISGYAPGVYMLQLETKSGDKHVKIILD